VTSQPLQALARANEVRIGQAGIRARLAAMPKAYALAKAAEYLEDPPEAIHGLTVHRLLTSCHNVGDLTARRITRVAGVLPERKVGALTSREREALVLTIRREW
jgi:hypothetical protein